jgi:hypothetical protein
MPVQSLVVPDLRRPGEAMRQVPLKLPASLVDELQAQADRMGTTRSALARTLVLRGLEQLQAPAAD